MTGTAEPRADVPDGTLPTLPVDVPARQSGGHDQRTADDPASRPAPPPGAVTSVSPRGVAVVEPPLPRRVRRPSDLGKALLVLLAAALLLAAAVAATGTTSGLESDLVTAVTGLPAVLLQGLQSVFVFGIVLLPLAIALWLAVRRRLDTLLLAMLAAGIGILVSALVNRYVPDLPVDRLIRALTKQTAAGERTPILEATIVGLVAFLTVADLRNRLGWQTIAGLTLLAAGVTTVLGNALTLVALGLSFLIGLLVGFLVRYLGGAEPTRPPGVVVADALVSVLPDLTLLQWRGLDGEGGRSYDAWSTTERYEVSVLDEDTQGSGAGYRLWRRFRLRGPAAPRPRLTVRSMLEGKMLLSLALENAGAPVRRVHAAVETGADAAAVALDAPAGATLAETPGEELTTEQVAAFWDAVALCRQNRIAYRNFTPTGVRLPPEGGVMLDDLTLGEVAASDIQLRLDLSQALSTMALKIGPERAVATALRRLGPQALEDALPLLQRIVLSRGTRRELRSNKKLLPELREAVIAATPFEGEVEELPVERFKTRTVLMVLGLGLALYLVLPQLARINVEQIRSADLRWAGALLAFSLLTYIGAALTIYGTILAPVPYLRVLLTQFAASFAALFAPTTVGTVALNVRMLTQAGVDPAVAVSSVGLAQVGMFVATALLLLLFGVAAGTSGGLPFSLPAWVVPVVLVVIVVVIVALSVPWVRKQVQRRVGPLVRRVIPRLIEIVQRPVKVAELLGGGLILNTSYVLALYCAVEAFGGSLPVAAVAVVYFTGSLVGSAVPTPGGLGGVEAAMSAALVAAGLDGGTAISAVLLYRIATYWLPIPVGYLSLQWLTRRGAI